MLRHFCQGKLHWLLWSKCQVWSANIFKQNLVWIKFSIFYNSSEILWEPNNHQYCDTRWCVSRYFYIVIIDASVNHYTPWGNLRLSWWLQLVTFIISHPVSFGPNQTFWYCFCVIFLVSLSCLLSSGLTGGRSWVSTFPMMLHIRCLRCWLGFHCSKEISKEAYSRKNKPVFASR